jgi:hypothetical protein
MNTVLLLAVYVAAVGILRYFLFKWLASERIGLSLAAVLMGGLWASFPLALSASGPGPINWLAAAIAGVALFVGVAGAMVLFVPKVIKRRESGP